MTGTLSEFDVDVAARSARVTPGVRTIRNDWKSTLAVIIVSLVMWLVSVPGSLHRPDAYAGGYFWDQAVYAECAQSFVAGHGLMQRTAAGVDAPIWTPLM